MELTPSKTMSTKTITWSDYSTSKVTYTGSGTETLTISHAANTGLDRTASLTVTAGTQTATLSLKQYGQCEYLVSSGNTRFRDSSSSVIYVPKTNYNVDGTASTASYGTINYTTDQINNILAKIDAWGS